MKNKEKQQEEDKDYRLEVPFLVLHNDDVNTFEFVIEALIEVCNHNEFQAEQCALITHYKGKCDVKKGDSTTLSKMKTKLNAKGLIASVES